MQWRNHANSREFATSGRRKQANGEFSGEIRRNQANSGENRRNLANSPGVDGEGWRTQLIVANLKLVGPIEGLKCGCCRHFCYSGEIVLGYLWKLSFHANPQLLRISTRQTRNEYFTDQTEGRSGFQSFSSGWLATRSDRPGVYNEYKEAYPPVPQYELP